MKKFFTLYCTLVIFTVQTFAQSPKNYSSSEIVLQLKKLQTLGSVLYIAAHPDDENTRLLAYLANEKCLRTAYLSLTRGDGGQNLIGPEQGIELGIIRTQELLAARRIDGAEQFFTRAYDFGYSKTPEETFTKWNHDSVLSDMVFAIRYFRPDIIITRFGTDGSGGHGHHTASAILAQEAFEAAADPNRFTEQLNQVSVWQTKRMYYNNASRFWNPNADMKGNLKLDVGGYNKLLGKSYGEIAAESRSMHKSQGFGSARQRGQLFEYFKPIAGDTVALNTLFDGIDFTWNRIPGMGSLDQEIGQLIQNYAIQDPSVSLIAFEKIYSKIQQYNGPYSRSKILLANKIIENLAGIYFEVNCNSALVTSGSKQKINIGIIKRTGVNFQLESILINETLRPSRVKTDTNQFQFIAENQMKYFEYETCNPSIEFISQPHFLRNPIQNNQFVIPDPMQRIMPEIPMNNLVEFEYRINSLKINTSHPIQFRWVDPEKGELYKPMIYSNPISINLPQKSFLFTKGKTKEIIIRVKSNKDSVWFRLIPFTSKGFSYSFSNNKTELTSLDFFISKKGEEISIPLFVTSGNDISEGTLNMKALVNGIAYSNGIREINYNHIPLQTWFPQAEAKLVLIDLKRNMKTIAYIEGAGDEVPAALEQMGYHVVKLSDEQLQSGDLSVYPCIIIGIRGFNTNEKLQLYKQRVFEYVKKGGNLLVQYNTNSFAGPLKEQISPIPFKLGRERVTIEESPVQIAIPNHPVLNTPNKINSNDFTGWVQERGIYFAGEMDSSFACPLLLNDPGEKPNKGGLVIASYGKGHYIYTGLSFFRQLPAGIPGPCKLFINLIEMGFSPTNK